MLQASVSEFHPEQAAKWRVAAGGGLSVQTLAEMQSGGALSDAAMNDLWLHDAEFVADKRREQATADEKQLAWLDSETDRLRRGREGDAAVDRENAKQQAERDAREASAKHAAEMQKRIDARRQKADALAGRFAL